MGKRQADPAADMDQPRTCAATHGPPVRQTRRTLYLSRFHAVDAANPDDGGFADDPILVAATVLYARDEPAPDSDWGVLHDALAVRIHWPGDEAVVLHIALRLFGAPTRATADVAVAYRFCRFMRSGFDLEDRWSCAGAGDSLSDLRPV